MSRLKGSSSPRIPTTKLCAGRLCSSSYVAAGAFPCSPWVLVNQRRIEERTDLCRHEGFVSRPRAFLGTSTLMPANGFSLMCLCPLAQPKTRREATNQLYQRPASAIALIRVRGWPSPFRWSRSVAMRVSTSMARAVKARGVTLGNPKLHVTRKNAVEAGKSLRRQRAPHHPRFRPGSLWQWSLGRPQRSVLSCSINATLQRR